MLAATGMVQADVRVEPPNLTLQWMLGNLATLLGELGNRWPRCASELTDEVVFGLRLAQSMYNLNAAAAAELLRIEANEVMARAFADVDFIIAATNPGPAFDADAVVSQSQSGIADWAMKSKVVSTGYRGLMAGLRVAAAAFPKMPPALLAAGSAQFPDLVNMGALTIISNIYGNPAVSIPAGMIDGLPVGMQVLAPHHADALLLDVALAFEREHPWPLVAPSARRPRSSAGESTVRVP